MSKGGPDPTDRVAHADLEDPDEHVVILCRDDVIASDLANPAGAEEIHMMSVVMERRECERGETAQHSVQRVHCLPGERRKQDQRDVFEKVEGAVDVELWVICPVRILAQGIF
jgi:hypothetical protein